MMRGQRWAGEQLHHHQIAQLAEVTKISFDDRQRTSVPLSKKYLSWVLEVDDKRHTGL
jgi:hypothetical protein